MDLFTFLLCKKKGGGGVTYTLSADTVNKQIVLTPSKGNAQAITVPYATDASTVNGKDVPELENGKIPAAYLPSYVDDVLEYEDLAHFPAEGEVGKIYVARDTGLIYRWGGSVYAEINQSLALGETAATAYRGDRGKIAYDHSQSAHAPSNAEANQNAFSNITVGDTTIEADSKTDTFILEAGSNITLTPDASTDKITIAATDTTYSDATTSTSGLMSGSDKTKLNGIATGAEVNQNAFSNVKIGSTTVAADSKTDTLELEAGDNIELTPDSTNDKITISGIPVTRTIRDASIASFSDGGNAPIPSLTASIVPLQSGSGDPSPENERPISGWTEANLSVTGKNLLASSTFLRDTYINNNTGQVVSYNGWTATGYIPIEQNKWYRLLKLVDGSYQVNAGGGVYWACYDSNLNYLQGGVGDGMRNFPSNAKWIRTSSSTALMNKAVLCENSNVSAFITESDFIDGTTTTIPFTDGQGQSVEVFGGEVNVVEGKVNVTHYRNKVTSVTRSTSTSFYRNTTTAKGSQYGSRVMCDKFVSASSSSDVGVFINSSGAVRFNTTKEYATASEFLEDYGGEINVVYERETPYDLILQPTSIKSLDGENNVFASTGALREVTYRTQAYDDFIATRDLPDAISDIKTLKLDENQILIGDGNFDKIGLFMDNYYDENLDTTFTTEVTPQEIYLTSQPAESVNQTTIISGDRTEYQTSLLSGTEVINIVNAIGMEVNVKENGSITHGIKIVSGDIRLLGSDTWDGTNISLKDALAAIQNNLYIANYNKTASLSSGSNTVALDITGYTYNGSDIVNVYVDGLYKVNNTDYTITVNDSTGVASINYTAAAAATMAIQVIKPKIGFTALTDGNGDNVTDNSGNSIDI